MSTQLADVLAARILEQLAGNGSASLSYVAQKLNEDPVMVGQVAAKLERDGLIERTARGVHRVGKIANAQMHELVVEDEHSLLTAAQILIEATDSPGENVEPEESVQDAVPDVTESVETTPDTDNQPGGDTIDNEPTVQDQVPQDTSNPAPSGDGAVSDAGTTTITEQDSVHDAVPNQSADSGVGPDDTAGKLPGTGE